MSATTRTVQASPDDVWKVLADGWLYPVWVVGASRMRDVDESWPGTGAQLHHSVGVWPMLIDDHTDVLASEPGQSLRLRARGWPAGEAEVQLTLTASGSHCDVAIEEDIVSGPGLALPGSVRQQAIKWRNEETLRRLAYIAERRQ